MGATIRKKNLSDLPLPFSLTAFHTELRLAP